ncbi:MAG: hypothetical protein ACYC6V_04470 [Bacillota bacterium]
MGIIRTPDERFRNLPGFPYPPHDGEVDGRRVHYIDDAGHFLQEQKGEELAGQIAAFMERTAHA